jgi:hypothetical protein
MYSQLCLNLSTFYFFQQCFICGRSDSTVSEFAGIEPRSRIHERTISWRFPGIILRVLRLEVSVYNVNITIQFQTTFAQGGGGVKSVVEVTLNSKEENS